MRLATRRFLKTSGLFAVHGKDVSRPPGPTRERSRRDTRTLKSPLPYGVLRI